jgi:Spy/CpxP family protein refolding chaperone
MTRTQAQIIEMFRTLGPDERQEVMSELYETAVSETFYDRMTPEQRAQLQDGIAQADRGDVVDANQAMDRLAREFGFKRS